jgi:branched-chain amino acid transport system substrate-binding protein
LSAPEGPPRNRVRWIAPVVVALVVIGALGAVFAFQPSGGGTIVIGAPLATSFLYGYGAKKGLQMAVDEINAAGGVLMGGQRYQFQLEVIDTRDWNRPCPSRMR